MAANRKMGNEICFKSSLKLLSQSQPNFAEMILKCEMLTDERGTKSNGNSSLGRKVRELKSGVVS
jgi:hypothetical protein